MKDNRLYESIKYTFGKDEIRELGESLAHEAQTVFDLKAQKKSTNTSMNASIENANNRVADLTTKINNGYELREVECLVMMETPRAGMKTIIRIDTNEKVREEAMTMAEMQQNFGFTDGAGE